MEVTETTSDGLKRELKVVIGASELEQRLSTRLEELKGQVRIKGFRPGKVPVGHLRKVYGRSIMADIVQQTVAETSKQAIEEREERPAFQPEIAFSEDKDEIEQVIDGKADFSYTMSFEVLPEIEVTDFAKFKLERWVTEVSDENIDSGVDQLVESSTSYQTKEDAAGEGDQVTIDFVGSIDGEPFEGGKAEDAPLVIGRKSFIPGFEEGLIGAKSGETRTVTTTFPDDYPVESLAGKKADFEVTVKDVAEAVRPEVNDEFAKTLGFDALDKLREAVEEKLKGEFGTASRQRIKRTLLDKLEEAHSFELPQTLVDGEFETIWREVTTEMERAERSFEDQDTTEEKAREEYRKIAERRVRLGLVLSHVGEKNEIRVSDDEVQRSLMERVRQFPGQEQQVYEYYQKHPEALAELRAPIFEDKVVDYIIELADVTEKKVSADELFAADDDAEDAKT